MQDHVGDVFEGVVASVTNFGLFVRITEFQIDGLVHITSLPSDYYHFDEQKQCLVGEGSGMVYHLGDEVKIKVAGVNLDERKIDLLIEGTTKARASVKPPRKRSRSKSGAKKGSAKQNKGDAAKSDKPKAADNGDATAKPSTKKKPKRTGRKKSGPRTKGGKASKNKQRR
jgi:ribonuclease R